MTQQLTDEELRDEILSLYEEKEPVLLSHVNEMEKIEEEAVLLFNERVEEMKQRIIKDVNISDDDLVQAYENGLDEVRKSVAKISQYKIDSFLKSTGIK